MVGEKTPQADSPDVELTRALAAELRKIQDATDRAEQLIKGFMASAILEPTLEAGGSEAGNTFALSIAVKVPPAEALSARLQQIIAVALQDLTDVTASVTEE
jgi:hypothetical protein